MRKLVHFALVAVTLGSVVVAGCVRKVSQTYIAVPTTKDLQPTIATTRDVVAIRNKIAPVEGSTTSTALSFAKGEVVLSGVVTGPDGPVPDAVVVLTRILGDQRAEMRVTTNADGKYLAPQIKGGVVELFAFKPPSFSAGDGKVIFASGNMRQDLQLQNFADVEIRWSVGPGQPTVERPINLSLQLTVRRVDPDGVVRSAPLEGIGARIVPLGLFQPINETQKLTDAAGLVSFQMRCVGVGPASLQVFFASGEETTVEPRGCQLPVTTTLVDSSVPSDGSSTVVLSIPLDGTSTISGPTPVITVPIPVPEVAPSLNPAGDQLSTSLVPIVG
jgi:outer membrane murein-binding lipoprotein Lpp